MLEHIIARRKIDQVLALMLGSRGAVIHSGRATKLGGRFKTWRSRWFVLTEAALTYYVNEGDARPKGSIPISLCIQAAIDESCKRQPAFAIATRSQGGRRYQLVCRGADECNEWVLKINGLIGVKPGELKIEDFEIDRILGRGTYGKVQLVRYKKTNQQFAMKSLSTRRIVDFGLLKGVMTEHDVLLKADHPFVATAMYAFKSETELFLVMDYVPNGGLWQYLRCKGSFSEELVRFFAAEIICAVNYLHTELNVVHRDLKPGNILIDAEGHLKVTDYGMGIQTLRAGESTHTFCGTPHYMAPEVIQGTGHDARVDWWAVGILIFEMLTGDTPFSGPVSRQLYESIVTGDIRFPPSMSESAKALVSGLCQKSPEMRLSTFENIRNDRFFAGWNWEKTEARQIQPPWKPEVVKQCAEGQGKLSFDDPPELTEEQEGILRGFSMVHRPPPKK
jgi:serine/threonine protein kinase